VPTPYSPLHLLPWLFASAIGLSTSALTWKNLLLSSLTTLPLGHSCPLPSSLLKELFILCLLLPLQVLATHPPTPISTIREHNQGRPQVFPCTKYNGFLFSCRTKKANFGLFMSMCQRPGCLFTFWSSILISNKVKIRFKINTLTEISILPCPTCTLPVRRQLFFVNYCLSFWSCIYKQMWKNYFLSFLYNVSCSLHTFFLLKNGNIVMFPCLVSFQSQSNPSFRFPSLLVRPQ
jgi:hypothetical protein